MMAPLAHRHGRPCSSPSRGAACVAQQGPSATHKLSKAGPDRWVYLVGAQQHRVVRSDEHFFLLLFKIFFLSPSRLLSLPHKEKKKKIIHSDYVYFHLRYNPMTEEMEPTMPTPSGGNDDFFTDQWTARARSARQAIVRSRISPSWLSMLAILALMSAMVLELSPVLACPL